jgi:UPF0755 protein
MRKFLKIIVVLTLLLALAAGGTWAASIYIFKAVAQKVTPPLSDVVVQIPYGSSLKRVSELLCEAGVVEKDLFYWYLRFGHKRTTSIQAGFYEFDGQFNYGAVADRLLLGRDQSFKLTFVEGQTLNDLVRALQGLGLTTADDFIAAMTTPEIANLVEAEGLRGRQALHNDVGGLEGYLFPDTYFFSRKDTAQSIIKTMHEKLLSHLDETMRARMREQNLTLHQLLTLAAIVEKETGVAEERPRIASVYLNRLRIGMRLQADPTVIYGIKDYDGKIRKADLQNPHPYNTYKVAGLPPGPIAAPGLASIKAVLWPDETKYLYFVSRNDGSHVFCENLACHQEAVKKWQIDFFRAQAKKP